MPINLCKRSSLVIALFFSFGLLFTLKPLPFPASTCFFEECGAALGKFDGFEFGNNLGWRVEDAGVLFNNSVKVAEERVVWAEEIELIVATFTWGECSEEGGTAPRGEEGCQFENVTRER